MAPTFSPNVFVPFPLPKRPANTVPRPSNPIPLLIACTGGGGAPEKYENNKYDSPLNDEQCVEGNVTLTKLSCSRGHREDIVFTRVGEW